MLRRIILVLMVFASFGTAFATGTAEVAEPVADLRWMGIGPGEQRDAPEVWALFNEELQNYLPEVTVDFELVPPYEYESRFSLAMAAREQIDVSNRMWMQDFYETVDRDSFLPLNDLLETHGQGILSAVPDSALRNVSFEGQIYNIPTTWLSDWRPGLHFHKELADRTNMEEAAQQMAQYELATREVYDLLEPYLELAAEEGLMGTGISPTFLSWIWVKGYEEVAPGIAIRQDGSDMSLVNIFETESFRTVLDVAAEWYEKGYIREDYLGMDVQELRADDGRPLGEGAIAWCHNYLPTYSEQKTETHGIPIVVYAGGKAPYTNHGPGGNNLAIPTSASHPEEAMSLLNLMFTEQDLYDLLTYGIEGTHWHRVSPRDFEPIGYSGTQGTEDSPYGTFPWANGNYMDFFRLDPGADGLQWERDANMMIDTARVSPLLGFPKDFSPVATEMAQLRAVVADTPHSLLSGQLPRAEYDRFLDRLEAAGIGTVRDELQRQLDSWLQSQ